MAATLTLIPATISHVYTLAARLRADDRAEIEAAGFDPRKGLRRMYRSSYRVRTVLVDGEIAAMGGLGGMLLADEGYPWLMTTAAVERHPLAYVRCAQAEVAAALALKRILIGQVMASYARSVRFLALLGFTLDEPLPVGPKQVLHRKFWMERP